MKPTAERRLRRSGDDTLRESRREQIMDEAARLFARLGYSAADTQLLAEKLGIGKGTIYRYFPSKQDVFLAAVDRVMRRLHDQIEATIEGVADPLDRIAGAIRAYLAFFADHPDFVELLMQERAQFKDRKKPTYFVHREANVEPWQALYRELIAQGRVRPMPVERIIDVLSDLLYGTIFTNYFAGRSKPCAEQAHDILDVVFHGILSEPERSHRGPE
jgi:AcrR family transcriptional regulator